MNKLADPLKVVTDLEPTMLSRLAQEGYEKNRHDDLALMAAEGRRSGRAWVRRMPARPRLRLLAGGVVAIGAAAAVAVAFAQPASHPSPATRGTAAGLTAHGFLLTSAVAAARAPATSGTYWYVRQRDYASTIAILAGGHTKGHVSPARKDASFGASFASTEESWTGNARARTIVNEDLAFTFASASDKARWEAAGKPPLYTAYGTGTEPVTSNYTMTSHWGVGRAQLSLAQVQQLPTTANALDKALRKLWAQEPDKAGVLGLPHPTFGQYLVQWAASLLPGPARPGTKAAIYQLLAGQPGLSLVKGVTDPAGRAGIAIGDGGGGYLIIKQGTGTLLAYVAHPVKANSAIKGDGVAVYETTGWTNQLGVAP